MVFDLEKATLAELDAMPKALRTSGIAVSALILARRIDSGASSDRDLNGLAGQYRQHMNDLRANAPGERKGDTTDDTRSRIEENRQLHLVAGE